MVDVTNNVINKTWRLAADNNAGPVHEVILVLMPREILVAGYNESGIPVASQYYAYEHNMPEWIFDFFEHHFLNEPLLSKHDRVRATYIASNQSMLIPAELHDEDDARKWMDTLYYISKDDDISLLYLDTLRIQYQFAWPAGIRSLTGRYFTKTKMLPLAYYQLCNVPSADTLYCFLAAREVTATLYIRGSLQWHHVFSYNNAEDIAYYLRLLCQQLKIDIDSINLEVSTNGGTAASLLENLAQYFPEMHVGGDQIVFNGNKNHIAFLLQQLYKCAL
jgi:hypothetical protein